MNLSLNLAPGPWINITSNFEAILQAFQNLVFVGELRERWSEIKKLQPNLTSDNKFGWRLL